MDGEFSTVKIMDQLQNLGINFIAIIPIRPRIRPLAIAYELTDNLENLRQFKAATLLDHSKKYSTTVQVTCQNVKGEMKGIATSIGMEITPEEAISWYKHRFGIETGYRDKHLFQGRTCSKSIEIRLILYDLPMILWNIWQVFLVLLKDVNYKINKKLNQWRKEIRTIRLILLRDELL